VLDKAWKWVKSYLQNIYAGETKQGVGECNRSC